MTIRRIVDDVIKNGRVNKITGHEYKGKFFTIAHFEFDHGTVIPTKYLKKNIDKNTLFIFKTRKKGTLVGWYCILEYQVINMKKSREYSSDILIDDAVLTPIEEFNEDQARAIVDGTYHMLHDKYLDIYSVNDIILCIYRDKFTHMRCRKVIRGFDWYFYVFKREYEKMIEVLSETNHDRLILKTESDNEYYRVYCKNYSKTEFDHDRLGDPAYIIKQKLMGRVQTFEADISLAERYTIDNHVKIDTDLWILYYDIETDDSTAQIDMEKNRILSIGAVDNFGKQHYKSGSDELEIIKWWMALTKQYDVIVGYNSYNFDAPYITTRAKMYNTMWGASYKPWRLGHIDMMRRIIGSYGKFTDIRSFSLENVAQHFIGRGKVKHEEKIIELFENNKSKLREYNLMDCQLLKDLDEALGVSRLMIAMCSWTGCFPTIFRPTTNMSGISVARMLDIFILRLAKDKSIHYPTVYWGDNSGERFEGAYVMEPEPGIYDNVYIFDFKSLYPTIIWSWNISPENVRKDKRTKEELIESANEIYFYKKREAIFPSLVEQLMNARKEYRKIMVTYPEGSTEYKKYDVMQQVAKELTNSLYGALGQRGSRYFDFDVAGSVTAAGRFLIKTTKDIIDSQGMRVIYGDTDSVFVTGLESDPQELCDNITKQLSVVVKDKFNIDSTIIELEYEKKFNRFISIAMKNYAGIREGKQTPDIKGLDCVKKSTIAIAKREQEKLLYELLTQDYPLSYYMKKVETLKSDFHSKKPHIDDIVQKTSISKHPKDLKTLQPHARVALKLIEEKKEFYIGMQIPYIITDKKNKGVVHVDEYDGEFDKEYYWDRLYTPIKRVLDVCFSSFDWSSYIKKERKPRKSKKEVVKAKGKFVIKKSRFIIKRTESNTIGD